MISLGYRVCMIKDINREEQVSLAKDLGLRAIELGFEDVKNEKEAIEWKELAEKYGIEISCMGAGFSLCDPTLVHASRRNFSDIIKYAKIIGIKVLFSQTKAAPHGMPQKSSWDTCIQMTKEFARACEQEGFKFSIEIDHSPCFINNLERLEYLLEKVNEPNLHVNFDPTNFYVSGSNPLTVIDRLKHLFTGGHIKDGIYRTEFRGETKIGYGEVGYRQIFEKLNQANIDIAMNFEHCKSYSEVIEANNYISAILNTL